MMPCSPNVETNVLRGLILFLRAAAPQYPARLQKGSGKDLCACRLLSSLDDGRSGASASSPPRPAEPRGGRERSRYSGTCGLADDDPQTSARQSFLAPASILRVHQSAGSGICRDDDSDLSARRPLRGARHRRSRNADCRHRSWRAARDDASGARAGHNRAAGGCKISVISPPGHGAVMPRRAYRRTVESHAKLSVLFSSNRGRQAYARFVVLFTPLPQNRKSQFNGVLDTATSPPSPSSAEGRVGFQPNFRSSMRQLEATARDGATHGSTRLAFVILLPYCGNLRCRASPGPRWRRILPGVALWHPTERLWWERWTNSPKSSSSEMLPFCFRIDKIHDGSA